MIEWSNRNWINKGYFDNLQKYQLIESFRRNPEKIFQLVVENFRMKEEITNLKRQIAEQNRP
jgi:hypothetical protein